MNPKKIGQLIIIILVLVAGYFFYTQVFGAVTIGDTSLTRVTVSKSPMPNVASSLQTGLTGYWTFDGPDVSGTTVLDKSGNGYNAVNYSTSGSTPVPIVPVIGKLGQGIDFTDLYYLNTTNASNLITASEGAISV